MASVDVDGRRVVYTEAGEGPGSPFRPRRPAVVFLHGWGLGIRPYRRVHAQLRERGVRVVAPDLPGFGASSPLPPGRRTLDDHADWVAAFCAEAGLGRVVLVGHSFGGGVAIATAHRHPRLVRALVLVNSVGGASLRTRPLWHWGLGAPSDAVPVGQALRLLPSLLREAVPNAVRNPAAVARAAGLARSSDLTAELEALRRRRVPVAVLWAASDRVIPETAFDDLCRALGATGQVVEGNHSWLLADPAAFAEALSGVLVSVRTPNRVRRMARTLLRRRGGGGRRSGRRRGGG
jgi:pimeloyl-ACP methyl ester carboxylesterase